MVCPVCHCFCDDDTAHRWGIFVKNPAETFTFLPCSVRDNLTKIKGGFLNFKANGHKYSLDVYRGHNTTMMGGDDWVKFIADFNLGHGELVVFDASHRNVKASAYCGDCPSAGNYEEPHEAIVVDDDKSGEGVVSEEELLNDVHMQACHLDIVCSRNVVLSEVEASRLDVVLTIKNGFIGLTFMHRLTETNVKSLKIQKKVADTLNKPSSVVVGICLRVRLHTKLDYKTDIDRRMVIRKGWGAFASQKKFQVGEAIACRFINNNVGGMNMIYVVDVLKMPVE